MSKPPLTVRAFRKGIRPLYVSSNSMVVACRNELYRCDYDLQNFEFIAALPLSSLGSRLGKYSRLADRVLRTSPTRAVVSSDNRLWIIRKSEVWCCDLSTKKLSLDFLIPEGRRALDMSCLAYGRDQEMLVFGEYFDNPQLGIVRIWGKLLRGKNWECLYTFQVGEIEHIHAITADTVSGDIWILTGDFGGAAGIWRANKDFSQVRPLVRGKQEYRAAWITQLGRHTLFATDTQLEQNRVYSLSLEGDAAHINVVGDIEGSSIYSAAGEDRYFFSTTVESGLPSGNRLYDLLDRKRGPGIVSQFAKIMQIDSQGMLTELYAAEKDCLPFRLGQFGTFMFPSGKFRPDTLVAYGVALKGCDDTCIVFA